MCARAAVNSQMPAAAIVRAILHKTQIARGCARCANAKRKGRVPVEGRRPLLELEVLGRLQSLSCLGVYELRPVWQELLQLQCWKRLCDAFFQLLCLDGGHLCATPEHNAKTGGPRNSIHMYLVGQTLLWD